MNLARQLMAADAKIEGVKIQIEAMLTTLFPGWQSWRHMKPYGIEVFGAFDSARGAAALHARGFVTVLLHDHRATERVITCRCKAREV